MLDDCVHSPLIALGIAWIPQIFYSLLGFCNHTANIARTAIKSSDLIVNDTRVFGIVKQKNSTAFQVVHYAYFMVSVLLEELVVQQTCFTRTIFFAFPPFVIGSGEAMLQ